MLGLMRAHLVQMDLAWEDRTENHRRLEPCLLQQAHQPAETHRQRNVDEKIIPPGERRQQKADDAARRDEHLQYDEQQPAHEQQDGPSQTGHTRRKLILG